MSLLQRKKIHEWSNMMSQWYFNLANTYWESPMSSGCARYPGELDSASTIEKFKSMEVLWTELCLSKFMLKSWTPVPQNVTLFGDRVFQGLVKLGWVLFHYDCPYKKRSSGRRHAQREERVKTQGEDGHRYVKERGLRRSQPCRHLYLGLPACRAVKPYISVV